MPEIVLPRGIRQRENGNYVVERTVDGKRRPVTFKQEQLAEAIAFKAALDKGQEPAPPPPPPKARTPDAWTLDKLFEYALETPHREGGFAGQRGEMAEYHARTIKKYFGASFPIDQLRRDTDDERAKRKRGEEGLARTLDGLVKALRLGTPLGLRPNKEQSIDKIINTLRKTLKLAVRRKRLGALPEFPARLSETLYKVRWYSDEEEAALLGYVPRSATGAPLTWFSEVMTVLIDMGLRFGELAGIQKSDINFALGRNGIVLIHGVDGRGGKTMEYRSVPMTRRVAAIMRRRTAKGWEPFDYHYKRVFAAFRVVRRRLGLSRDKDFTLHTARHTCASRLVQRGVDITVVQKWLGHKKIETTMRYAHLAPKNLYDAVDALEPAQTPVQDAAALKAAA
jgi:integrase